MSNTKVDAATQLKPGVTGTGNVVLATSPTITTAALGSSTATTQAAADNSTKVATTAYVDRAAGGTTEFTTTSTGNIDDLDFSNAATIRMNNATLATIRGLKAGTAGQRVIILSIGAGQVDLPHQSTGDATAASRLINYVTGGPTSLAAGKGSATYVYDGTTSRWRLASHEQGGFIDLAYAAGNFTGSGTITWTVDSGDQVSYRYKLVGKMMFLMATLNGTTVAGTGVQLRVAIPLGFTGATGSASNPTLGPYRAVDNNAENIGIANVVAGTTYIQCFRGDFSNWAASTNLTTIQFAFFFEVD